MHLGPSQLVYVPAGTYASPAHLLQAKCDNASTGYQLAWPWHGHVSSSGLEGADSSASLFCVWRREARAVASSRLLRSLDATVLIIMLDDGLRPEGLDARASAPCGRGSDGAATQTGSAVVS